MGICEYCREIHDLVFQCSFCHKYLCNEHLPPNMHYCTSISREDVISEIKGRATLSETLLDSLLFVTMMFIYAFIMAVAVLAVDAVVLLLFKLWNVDTWLNFLWVEGVIMAFIGGAAGYHHHKAPLPWATPMGTRLYWIKFAVRKPLFWASFGIAGFMLILVRFLIWQFH